MRRDIAIIGGGIVGSAIARQLAVHNPTKSIVVIEKHEEAGRETSTKNSGVIHSGIHQNPSFLKTRLAVRGSALTKAYARMYGVPMMHCGMIIPVLPSTFFERDWWGKIKELYGFISRAKTCGVRISYRTSRGVKKLEPHLRSIGGLFLPDVAVIDQDAFVRSMYNQAKRYGVSFLFQSKVSEITYGTHYTITAGATTVHANTLINAAGLYADEIARMAGINQYTIYPWRGEYYEVSQAKRSLISRLVYFPPSPRAAFKGIHFSPRPDGRLYLGPNARLMQSKEDYQSDKTPASVFHNAVHRFCPSLEVSDLTWAYAGIRARRVATEHDADYLIRVDRVSPPLINLIGIDSPGVGSATAIGEYVADLSQGLKN